MGSYSGLLVFDSDKFYNSVVPKLKRDVSYIKNCMESDAFKLFIYRDVEDELNPELFQEFLKSLSFDCKIYSGDMKTTRQLP